jgi:hypothetical protein
MCNPLEQGSGLTSTREQYGEALDHIDGLSEEAAEPWGWM